MLVDRHTFADKHTSLYFLCFYRLRFKKCSCVPFIFCFLICANRNSRVAVISYAGEKQ